MLKLVALITLFLIAQVPESKANFADYYLDYFGLRDTYIPYFNDDLGKIEEYKSKSLSSREYVVNLIRFKI